MKRGQIWALDSIIAMVIFVSALSAFIVLITANYSADNDYLKSEAKVVPQILLSSNSSELSLVEDNRIDMEKLKQAQEYDYEELRSIFGIRGQFCIYFEDKEGNLLDLSEITEVEGAGYGIGSSEVELSSGVYCSE